MSKDGLSGFAISKDGDLVSVFNANAKRGFLKSIAPIVKEKAATLDCYVSNRQNLQEMYSKVFGFKTAAIMDFNYEMLASKKGKAYADWFVSTYGEAPVAFMVNTDEDVETKRFGKGQYYEAKAYQLSYAKKKSKAENTAETVYEDAKLAKGATADKETIEPSIEEEISKRYGKDHASAPARMVIEASNAKDGKVATKRSILDLRKVVEESVDDILSRGNIPGQKAEAKTISPSDTQDLFAKINLADESRIGEIKAKAFEKIEDLEVIYKDDVDGVRETYALKDLLDENERAELRERFDEAFSDMLSRRKDSRPREFADRVSRLIEFNGKAENLPQYLSNHLGKENPLYAAVVDGWTKANGNSQISD